ncbi:FdhF/YdeP family oxidoreductase [soil metagenome]
MKEKRFDRSQWVSLKPFGIGEDHPNNFAELWRAARENRDNLPYAWRILTQGTCDGCALGTAGLADWTVDEVHLCNVRLRLLRLNTMAGLDPARLADVGSLASMRSAELRDLGRLPHPMVRRRGDAGFARIGWDEALDLVASRIRATTPDRLAFYLTSRGAPNETSYTAQKAARALGTNSIDNAARICHSPSTMALKETIGAAATTCSYTDWIGSDLVVFIGSNPANNQPVAMKYLYHAKKAGTKVVVVNPYREPGMERYWVPSNVESALFGTKIADAFFTPAVGGDAGFLNGTLKHLVATGRVDRAFVDTHTTGYEAMVAELDGQSWEELEAQSGVDRSQMQAFADLVGAARTAVLVWSMGVTQHANGEDNVRAIVNLALTGGFVGRDKCGLMPIRGHSGVQGGAEMGAYATAFPGGVDVDEASAAHFSDLWGFEVPSAPGRTAPEMIDAAHDGELDVFVSSGGNFLEVLPDPVWCREALGRIGLRVHLDIVLSSQMLVDPDDTVVLLPAATRYETPGGVTETSTERRVIFSPEVPGPRIGEARPEWEVFSELARRARPEVAGSFAAATTGEVRTEIARAVPIYAGIQHLDSFGDQFQYGGPHLCFGWRFPTADGKAHFSPVPLPAATGTDGRLRLTTRRGKQFNSMVHERTDVFNGAGRDAVLMSGHDAARLGLEHGGAVTVHSDHGSLAGTVHVAPMAAGNVAVHWPEGEVLLDRKRRSPQSGIPDYNALVTLEVAEPT